MQTESDSDGPFLTNVRVLDFFHRTHLQIKTPMPRPMGLPYFSIFPTEI